MTVNVVNRDPSPKVLKFQVCHNCGVELSYVPNDVLSYVHRDYGGGSDTYYYIPCPSCAEKVSVKRWQ